MNTPSAPPGDMEPTTPVVPHGHDVPRSYRIGVRVAAAGLLLLVVFTLSVPMLIDRAIRAELDERTAARDRQVIELICPVLAELPPTPALRALADEYSCPVGTVDAEPPSKATSAPTAPPPPESATPPRRSTAPSDSAGRVQPTPRPAEVPADSQPSPGPRPQDKPGNPPPPSPAPSPTCVLVLCLPPPPLPL